MVMGVPGKVVRETTMLERERIRGTVDAYVKLQQEHALGKHERIQNAE
jgi:carbonic anhydrase/acetyltransferase-like protein (isoleucine patch superfamily)